MTIYRNAALKTNSCALYDKVIKSRSHQAKIVARHKVHSYRHQKLVTFVSLDRRLAILKCGIVDDSIDHILHTTLLHITLTHMTTTDTPRQKLSD